MLQTEAIDLLFRIYFWVVSVIILLKTLVETIKELS